MDTNNQIPTEQELQQMSPEEPKPSNPSPQIIIQPMLVQNPVIQLVPESTTPNRCEKLSNLITGSKNLPLTVFIILLLESLNLILSLFIFSCGFYSNVCGSIGNFLFALFVWTPMAAKIERCSSTARYSSLFFINSAILSLITFRLPNPICITRLWCFILFETIIISSSNEDKQIKCFFWKVSGKKLNIIAIVYSFIFNCDSILCIVLTVVYAVIYKKKLTKKFMLSNEKVTKIENFCFCSFLKRNLKTFITLEECLNKSENQNSNNSSFVPANLYPNYYSNMMNQQGVINQPQVNYNLPPIQQPFQPSNNVNMAGEPQYNYVPENSATSEI